MTDQSSQISERNIVRLLGFGFAGMVCLVAASGIVGVQAIRSIRTNVSALTEDQFRTVILIDEVQRAQTSLSSVIYALTVDRERANPVPLRQEIASAERLLKDVFARIPSTDRDIERWREVERASWEMKEQAEQFIQTAERSRPDLAAATHSRERLLNAISSLILANHEHAVEMRRDIDLVTDRQMKEDAALLALGLVIACLCAWIVIRTARRLYRQVALQSDELDRVSWQLLERQETLARRLSHELHDELGQSLTALKTNLSRHGSSACADPAWLNDCTSLLRDAIRNVHEISQLLRPTILDDFGLEAALAWLCERFEERNAIQVFHQCKLTGRLDEQAETHVFRIAQEALTNVARHAKARKVMLILKEEDGSITLRVEDDGSGMQPGYRRSSESFGVTGMQARARSLNGNMSIQTEPGHGTAIEVSFPRAEVFHAEEDPHPVGG